MIRKDANYCANFSFKSKRCYPSTNVWADCSECDMFENKVGPCPKCGGDNVRNFIQYEPYDAERFECLDCGAATTNHRTLPAALRAWNAGEVMER